MYFSSLRSCGRLLLVRYLLSSSGMIPSYVTAVLHGRRAAAPGKRNVAADRFPTATIAASS